MAFAFFVPWHTPAINVAMHGQRHHNSPEKKKANATSSKKSLGIPP